MTPEAKARVTIDALLTAAGWHVCSVADANIHAAVGVAIREFPLNPGYGYADYLLYVNGKACGVIEAKKEGATLTGVELQSSRYAKGLPTTLPAWSRPLPFVWESNGVETHFTNGPDPEPRARSVFAFFRPELLVQWLALQPPTSQRNSNGVSEPPRTVLDCMRNMPKLNLSSVPSVSTPLQPAAQQALTSTRIDRQPPPCARLRPRSIPTSRERRRCDRRF